MSEKKFDKKIIKNNKIIHIKHFLINNNDSKNIKVQVIFEDDMVLTDINKIFSKKIEIIPIISSVGVNEVYISLFNFEQQEEIFELRKIHLKEIEKSTK